MSHFASAHLDGDPEGLARLHALLHGPAPGQAGDPAGGGAAPGRSVKARQGRPAAKAARAPLPSLAERFGAPGGGARR